MQKHYMLILAFLALSFNGSLWAQQQAVSGTVTDGTSGSPLPGVTIVEKGTSNGTTTDFDGKYSLSVPQTATLVFSYVGYTSIEKAVSGQTTIDVELSESAEALNEVVVTSLGITREKKSLGYSVTELQSDDLNTVKDNNVANSLVGKVAGVNITQSGGIGSGSRVVIRGNNTITGQNQALIVVDGVPIDASGSDSGGDVYHSSVTGGGITDINPADIESVSVLKGPNAAALYGSRAASGVLLITTKKGSRGNGLGISLNSNVTLEGTMFLPDYQNQYGQGTNGAVYQNIADYGGGSWGGRLDGSEQLYYTGKQKPYIAYTDNIKNFFETGVKSINSLSIDKGGDDYSLRFSYTNNSTSSIIPNSKLESHNFNLRGVVDLSDKMNLDAKATYFTQQLDHRIDLGSEGLLAYVYTMPRSVDLNDLKRYKPSQYDDSYNFSEYNVVSYAGQGKSIGNPYWIQNEDTNGERRDRFIGFAKLNYEFTNWLSLFVRVGGDVTNIRSNQVNAYGHHFFPDGTLTISNRKNTEINSDFLFTAHKDLTQKLNLMANVGGNLSKRTYEIMTESGSKFKLPSRAFLANTNVQSSLHTPLAEKKVNSLYASLSLAYDDFMYLDLTGRNDWSSTLSEDNRSYFYPSVSYSLLLNRFIDPERNIFNLLKLRAGWAKVGNDTGVYQLYQTFSVPQNGYLGLTTLNTPNVRFKPDLKPESVVSTELGIEANMLKNRLYLDFSAYKIKTTDMIFDVAVPPATGYNFFRENVGEVENKGIEFLLGGVPIKTEDFKWDTSVNFSKNKNKLLSLIEGLDYTTLNTTNSGNVSIRASVGGGISDIYGTTWKTNENGERLVNSEGLPLASNDKVYLGNAQPDWTAGFSNTFSYKNLSLNVLLDGRFGGEIYSATSAGLDNSGVSERSLQFREGGVTVDALDELSGNPNAVNITSQQYWQNYSGIAAPYVYDQTNVRVREFSLTYKLPGMFVDQIGFNTVSVGLIGRNLFFIYRKADDIDPDANLGTGLSGQGVSYNNIPTVRSLGLNVNLKF